MELLDKDGNVIGSGTTDNTAVMSRLETPEGVTAKAYDNGNDIQEASSIPQTPVLLARQRQPATEVGYGSEYESGIIR